ncbi:MAG TPA: hypothetical protein VEL47_04215 [Myxococcota bacterium]|nr:hypothetical protein [Myxococcota bacterium]
MKKMRQGRPHCLLSLLALVAAMTVGSACDTTNRPSPNDDKQPKHDQGHKTEQVQVDNNDAVDGTFNMALGFASGKKSIEELKDLYDRLTEPQRKKLAEKSDSDGRRFATVMASGVASKKSNEVLFHFLRNLSESDARLQIESKVLGMNAVDIMRRNGRAASEKAEDNHEGLAILLHQTPSRINDLVDANNKFEAAKFNGVFTAAASLEPTIADALIKEITPANFDAWLAWASVNRQFAKITFVKFYAAGDDARKAAMRNACLAPAVAGGAKELAKFVADADALGLAATFATDTYKLRNQGDNGDLVGPILYVVAKRAAEEMDQVNPLMTVIDTKVVATKLQEITKADYVKHTTVDTFGAAPGETIMAALLAAGVVPTEAKVALGLPVDSNDILNEVKRIANQPAPSGQVASQLLEEMINGFATDPNTASLDALAAYTVQAADIIMPANGGASAYTGVLVENDKLIHVLSYLQTDERLLRIFEVLSQKVTNPAALVADDGAGASALKILCNSARDLRTQGSHHYQITALMVNKAVAADITKIDDPIDMKILLEAVKTHGAAEDLLKAFTGANDAVAGRVGRFCAQNPDISKAAFRTACATFDPARATLFHNALLSKVFSEGADSINQLVTEAADWGIKDGFATETYQFEAPYGNGGAYKGKFHYVLSMGMLDEYVRNSKKGFNLELMHKVSGEVKAALQAGYVNHVTEEIFTDAAGNNETLFKGLAYDLTDERVKYVLQLTDPAILTEEDVYREAVHVASRGPKTDTRILEWLYGASIDTDGKGYALSQLKNEPFRFIEALAALEVTDATNTMLTDILAKIEALHPNAGRAARRSMKANTAGGEALLRLIDNTRNIAGEDAAKRRAMIVNLVKVGGADAVGLVRSAADLDILQNSLIALNDVAVMQTFCQGVHPTLMPNLLTWIGQDLAARRPLFKAAFSSASPARKAHMGSGMLKAVFGQGPDGINLLIDQADEWGIRAGFNTDLYTLGEHQGSFLFVIANMIAEQIENDVAGRKFSLDDLHQISTKMKAILAADYMNHVTVMQHDVNNETLVTAMDNFTKLSRAEVHYALALDTEVSAVMIYGEAHRLATAKEGQPTKLLQWLYTSKVKSAADAHALSQVNDNGATFVHCLASAKATAETNGLLKDFLAKLAQHDANAPAVLLIKQDSAGRNPLRILAHFARKIPGEDVGERQNMITKLINAGTYGHVSEAIDDRRDLVICLDAVLAKGVAEDMTKVFNGTHHTLVRNDNKGDVPKPGLSGWAYTYRDKTVAGQKIGAFYAAEYARRNKDVNAQFTLRNSLAENAWDAKRIGDINEGIVSIIAGGFLPKEALMDGYHMFGDDNATHTLLFGVLHFTAQSILQSAMLTHNPNSGERWKHASQIIEIALHGGDLAAMQGLITHANANAIAQAGHAALNGALKQPQVQALAQALKSALGAKDWKTMCDTNDNSATGDKLAWELVSLMVVDQNNQHPDETATKSAALLDCQ